METAELGGRTGTPVAGPVVDVGRPMGGVGGDGATGARVLFPIAEGATVFEATLGAADTPIVGVGPTLGAAGIPIVGVGGL